MKNIIHKYRSVIGEFSWHSLTLDPNIVQDSDLHYKRVTECIKRWSKTPITTILEVAPYAHITGYRLQNDLAAEVTLFDLSISALKFGRRTAMEQGYSEVHKLTAGDFHHLPFDDCSFNLVYIFSAIHHTEHYNKVIKELIRVLAPNGLLLILNEPYQREACFYKFRCNRSCAYTAFEQYLSDIGLLWTIAEPHPGSRDETLFGMIENQQIPLKVFLDAFKKKCELIQFNTDYNTRIGVIEQHWIEWAADSATSTESLQQRIETDLNKKIKLAQERLDTVAMGLGFSLPDIQELKKMARHIAIKLHSCPKDETSATYKQHLSELFGGSISVIGHKKSFALAHKIHHPSSEKRYPIDDGVTICFPNKTASFLNNKYSLIPKLNTANSGKINQFFPKTDWKIQKEDNSLHALTPISTPAEIRLPPKKRSYLICLRINFSRPEKNYYRFRILKNSKLIYDYPVFREDAVLFQKILQCPTKSDCRLLCSVTAITPRDPPPATLGPVIKIYYAGLFSLPA